MISCSVHGILSTAVCQPCRALAVAHRILDPRAERVPLPWADLQLVAKASLLAPALRTAIKAGRTPSGIPISIYGRELLEDLLNSVGDNS